MASFDFDGFDLDAFDAGSFDLGAAADVNVSWVEFDSNATPVSVQVSWLELDTDATPVNVQVSWLEFDSNAAPASRHGFEMGGPTPRKVYIKRGKRIHIFETERDADEWEASELAAIQAIAKASRNAKKRAVRRVNASIEHETINLVELDRLVQHFGIPVELPTLEAAQDWLEVARIAFLAREMQDEEDIEMLLMA